VDCGLIQSDGVYSERWEDVICSLHNSASILEDLALLVKDSSGEGATSSVGKIGVWNDIWARRWKLMQISPPHLLMNVVIPSTCRKVHRQLLLLL
jgi:hypothetical protein